MTIEEIYQGAERLISQLLRLESSAQGHLLTGAMEDSFTAEYRKTGKENIMEGFAVDYTQYVNEGVPAASASMKQFPFLVTYFQKRGLSEKEAQGAAAATIKTWMKEGMSTQASKRFSGTGARQHMVESVFTKSDIDAYMNDAFDFSIDEKYHETKIETI